jgi:hypothetical protein
VRSFQPPLAKVQKSSPGFTPVFCDVRSTPNAPYLAVPGVDWVKAGPVTTTNATPAARRVKALIFIG